MTFTSLLRTLRERWVVLVAGLLVGLAVAAAVATFMPRTYAASSTLYVSASDTSQNAQNAYQGSLLSQQRIKSYTELAVSDRVLRPIAEELTPGRDPVDLADDVAVTAPLESTVMTVTVEDRDPERAAEIANAVATRFTQIVAQLEQAPEEGAPAPVTVSVVDVARPDRDPVRPDLVVDLVVGGVVGLVAAAAFALLRGALDSRIRTGAELQELTGATPLGALPLLSELKEKPGGLPEDPAYGEAVRRIRTNLLFADVDEPPRVLTVTSSLPAEGKTTLVCALAAAFAQTSSVAIVEADLRRPTIAERLGLVEAVGLTHVLTRRAAVADVMQRWEGFDVDVLVCGAVPPNPSELLSSQQMRDLLAELARSYDVVLVDGPPLVPVTDGAILAGSADGAILLCRQGRTTRSQVDASLEALRTVGARLLGSVMTMAPHRPTDSLYTGYHGLQAPPSDVAAGPAHLDDGAVDEDVRSPVPRA